jgi:hypothetical protein
MLLQHTLDGGHRQWTHWYGARSVIARNPSPIGSGSGFPLPLLSPPWKPGHSSGDPVTLLDRAPSPIHVLQTQWCGEFGSIRRTRYMGGGGMGGGRKTVGRSSEWQMEEVVVVEKVC